MKKLLLTSVFGPYGVDDEYGVKENKMELFHNQVTREQGIFSYRFNHNSQGLFFLAQNLKMPTTVLDFPTLKRFKKELRKGYDYVGISFIVPNFAKAKKMAEIIREVSPKTQIIVGGHGVSIPNIEKMMTFDHLCKGEGVLFLRKLFGENVNAPITHPLVYSSFNRKIMGISLKEDAGIISPGLGCANKCRFCCTTHFFGDYFSYLDSGQDIYDLCCRYEDEMGVTEFGVLDENFLKLPERALELLEIMEKNNRFFKFSIFSSAETIMKLGDIDILARLGVNFIWIGVESQKEVYLKNEGVNFKHLIEALRLRGISVLASAIMFLEEHDKKTVWNDVNYVIDLNPDYLQFMQLGPMPGTELHNDYLKKGKILPEVPYQEHHGQDKIWFSHPHFTREESQEYLKKAFLLDYEINGASLIRGLKTKLSGYQYFVNHSHDTLKRVRAAESKKDLELFRNLLLSCRLYSQNEKTDALIKEVEDLYRKLFGGKTLKLRLLSLVAAALTTKEVIRYKFIGDVRRPNVFTEYYNYTKKSSRKKVALQEGYQSA